MKYLILSLLLSIIIILIINYFIKDNFIKDNKITFKSLNDSNTYNKTIIITKYRTDLLGSFIQGILNIIIINIDKNILFKLDHSLIKNFQAFEHQNINKLKGKNKKINNIWETVGTETKDEHIKYRYIMLNLLFKYNYNNNNNNIKYKKISTTNSNFDLCKLSLKERTDNINNIKFKKLSYDIRENLKKYIPNSIKNNNIITIHFRAGEITNMSNRYIHSKEYEKLLTYLTNKYNLNIYVLISELPPIELDDLNTFKKYNCKILTSKECNTIESLSIYINSFIFVMARSSFSYVASLLRDHDNCITFYREFWHKKPHSNILNW